LGSSVSGLGVRTWRANTQEPHMFCVGLRNLTISGTGVFCMPAGRWDRMRPALVPVERIVRSGVSAKGKGT
jgi:hypothetical protein